MAARNAWEDLYNNEKRGYVSWWTPQEYVIATHREIFALCNQLVWVNVLLRNKPGIALNVYSREKHVVTGNVVNQMLVDNIVLEDNSKTKV